MGCHTCMCEQSTFGSGIIHLQCRPPPPTPPSAFNVMVLKQSSLCFHTYLGVNIDWKEGGTREIESENLNRIFERRRWVLLYFENLLLIMTSFGQAAAENYALRCCAKIICLHLCLFGAKHTWEVGVTHPTAHYQYTSTLPAHADSHFC